MVLFRIGTDKNRFRTHVFLSFPTCKRSPSFWNGSASFFPEPVVLRRQSFTDKPHAFYSLHLRSNMADKTRKLHHEKLQQKRLNLGKIIIRSFENTWKVIGYIVIALEVRVLFFPRDTKIVRRIHLLSFEVYGLKRMRTSISSFISLALSVPVSKKTACKRSLSVPRFSEDRVIFYPFPYKTSAYKRSNFVGTGTHFYPCRSASFDV